ncbi:MAG TPA: efflux RND transporter periplasmic adaptor subunit [Verrucomicrobiae bacterium]|nr:efflux RND transporter periplasmic adaptor subunit [Verrucomicrobiae bacterium]
MKPERFPVWALVAFFAFLSAAITWQIARWKGNPVAMSANSSGRKVKYYQSAMHPWVTSDKPGKCTVCGMDLVPVYEGEKGFGAADGLIALGSNSVTVAGVQSVPARRQPLQRTLRVAGIIDDDDTRHQVLSAYVEGRIEQLYINYTGAEVQKGQPLASLYSPMLLNAEREYLLLVRSGAGGHGPDHERLLTAATERLRRLGLDVDQIAALPGKPESDTRSEIRAPISGTVVKREVYAGQYVKEGDRLFEIADFSTMWFQFDAYERDLAWLRPGQRVEVTTPSAPGRVFESKISFIDPTLADQTRSAKVRVEVENPLVARDGQFKRELLHRLYAEAVVHVEIPAVLAVPRGAVLSPGGQPVLYVEQASGEYEQRRVTLGRAGDELWEILAGVKEGERVVTRGNLLIDSQAQLNQTVASGTAELAANQPSPVALAPLSSRQQAAIKGVLAAADDLGQALSADNLAQYNERASRIRERVTALADALGGNAAEQALVRPIQAASQFRTAPDLKVARKDFHAFSEAVVALAKASRGWTNNWGDMKIYQCPMLKNAFPGAPKTGIWLQLSGAIHNPYFGSEMLDCGTEVKP